MKQNEKKTKILLVITKSNWGGAQKYVYDLATNIPKDEFDVSVALGGSGILAQKLRAQNIRVIPIHSLARDISMQKDLLSFRELLHIFQTERPDVVHLNSSKIGGIGGLAARVARIPKIIFTAHGWAWEEQHRPFHERTIIKFLSWLTIMLATHTIAISSTTFKEGTSLPFVRRKITLIKNGVDAIDFLPRNAARTHFGERANITLNSDTILIGTIAELHKNKGLPHAIKACAMLIKSHPNIRYLIVGEGEERVALSRQIEQHHLQNHVFLLGFINNATRSLKAFDCFLLPSEKEGLPYVLLEAGLAKLPVIATNVGSIPDLIEHAKTGLLVPPKNSLALAHALSTLLKNTKLRAHVSENLHKKVLQNFSLEKMCEETVALYRTP